MPAVGAGSYSYLVYEQAGASPAVTDSLLGSGSVDWDGTAVLPLSTIDTNVDSILADTGTDGEVVASMATDSITAAALKADAVTEIADAILDEVVVGSYTLRQLLKVMAAALAGKATGGGTTTVTFRGVDDASNVIVATVDANGNRSAVTLTV